MRCAACRRRTPARALPSTRDHDLGRSRCRDLRAPGWTLQGYVLAVKQRRGAVTPATPEEVALGPLGPRASAEAAAARTSRSGAPGGRCRPASTSARRGESPSSPAEAKDDGIALPHRHDGALRRRNRGVAAPRSLGRSRGSRCRSPAAPCLESSPAPAISRSACRARPRSCPDRVLARDLRQIAAPIKARNFFILSKCQSHRLAARMQCHEGMNLLEQGSDSPR
jgi:hypothetical protein